MTVGTGIAKQVKIKVESTWGTVPGASGSQLLRRTSCNLSLKKATYESQELVSHYQRVDFRHGMRRVDGALNGELSPGTYKDLVAATLRKAFAAVAAITGASITVAGAGPTYTITRAAGSFLTDGIKAGQVVRLSAGSFNAANLNKNLFVLAVTSATVLTVMPLNGVALVAEGPIASSTVSVPGKETYTPTTGHTDLSYAIEHWHTDLTLSEVFSGLKVARMSVGLPASGMATIGFEFLGKDITTAGSEYFTSPTAETTTGIAAAVNGLLVAQGGAIAYVTGINFGVHTNMTGEETIGSNTFADITEGRVLADGTLTALFTSATMRDYFLNETEVALLAALPVSGAAAADFVTFSLPRVKLGGSDPDDGDKSIVLTLPFTGLYNSAGGAGVGSHQTTIAHQDSQA